MNTAIRAKGKAGAKALVKRDMDRAEILSQRLLSLVQADPGDSDEHREGAQLIHHVPSAQEGGAVPNET